MHVPITGHNFALGDIGITLLLNAAGKAVGIVNQYSVSPNGITDLGDAWKEDVLLVSDPSGSNHHAPWPSTDGVNFGFGVFSNAKIKLRRLSKDQVEPWEPANGDWTTAALGKLLREFPPDGANTSPPASIEVLHRTYDWQEIDSARVDALAGESSWSGRIARYFPADSSDVRSTVRFWTKEPGSSDVCVAWIARKVGGERIKLSGSRFDERSAAVFISSFIQQGRDAEAEWREPKPLRSFLWMEGQCTVNEEAFTV
jgi:hypothetical protein